MVQISEHFRHAVQTAIFSDQKFSEKFFRDASDEEYDAIMEDAAVTSYKEIDDMMSAFFGNNGAEKISDSDYEKHSIAMAEKYAEIIVRSFAVDEIAPLLWREMGDEENILDFAKNGAPKMAKICAYAHILRSPN
ncbi:MAG: hypothetical protein RIA64_08850 [Rhodospirillales bacterium]